MKEIRIEVWSDVVCPFCYIGKRRLEAALEKYPQRDLVHVVWKSFQLDPDTPSGTGKDPYTYLAERYGKDLAWSKASHEHVTKMAREAGLEYRFDQARIANSFDAHRIEHFARKYDKGNEMTEALFRAYFTEGKDISDAETLTELAASIGLDAVEAARVLAGSDFGNAVRQDIVEAQQLGVRGVPFFVFNRKYGVSGAQDTSEFSKVLEQIGQES